jgi:predicted acyl esterase
MTTRRMGQPLSSFVTPDDPQVTVIEDVWIPMADGARLAARVFLPA